MKKKVAPRRAAKKIRATARAPKRAAVRSTKAKTPPHCSFPIVGVGASAGGLEAIEQFLARIPETCGFAIVVVQHLDPTRKGILVELLQRGCRLPVAQIKDRTTLEPGHVYVIPPNKDLSVLHGVLHLLDPATVRGLRLPIDFFFRSLADDCHVQSIGVVLSGMGSDGALGTKAIKGRGGAVFVQSPESAKFDSMPKSVIAAGWADVIAPADELPAKIIAYLDHGEDIDGGDNKLPEKEQNAIDKVVILMRSQTGHDFSHYKKSTVYRRIERRMRLHQINSMGDYVRYLRENPQEAELLFKELLIGVTTFFRDAPVWEYLRNQLLPQALANRNHGGVFRAWTVGCSTGEEAYSLAMIFTEALSGIKTAKGISLQIFATDLDKDAVDKARTGVYPANIALDVSEERLSKFFVKRANGDYVVAREIRQMVTFAHQNLIMHPPFTKLDLLVCRNVLIYLETGLQKRLMPLFHYSLSPGGHLLLGSAETIGAATNLFAPVSAQSRLYRRLPTSEPANLGGFPAFAAAQSPVAVTTGPSRTTTPLPNLQSLADQMLLQQYCPAAVLVTRDGDIVYVNGRTGKYLEPAAGKANWNLFAMAREGLRSALSESFFRAVRQRAIVTARGVRIAAGDGTQTSIGVTVRPIDGPGQLKGMVLVVFEDILEPPTSKPARTTGRTSMQGIRLTAMAQELQRAHEELQATREEMQTSQEELKSSNEELQSMNEELQSSNEELTTSKEEMQSMNEELQTVNQEIQAKVEELLSTSDDMKNLLDSTDIAILFLDDALFVRRFTQRTAGIINLIPTDVGRPITDLVTTLDYPRLADDVRGVLRTLIFSEKEIRAHDGRWFTVRIMPYRTHQNKIDGTVITFSDITTSKKLESELRAAQSS